MSITAVQTTTALPGKYQRVRDGVAEMKEILEKQGVNVRLLRPLTGDHQGALSLVSEYESWQEFGAAAETIQSSSPNRCPVSNCRLGNRVTITCVT